MRQLKQSFQLHLRRINDSKRHPDYAVMLADQELTRLRFMTHGYAGWLPTFGGEGFSMPEASLWRWRSQLRRLKHEAHALDAIGPAMSPSAPSPVRHINPA